MTSPTPGCDDTPLIASWGELLWDLFPDERRLGGCAANVAFHLHQLGDRVALVSRVGDDALGRAALAELEAAGVDTRFVQVDPDEPTGAVRVTVVDGEPSFSIAEQAAWDRIELDEDVLALASDARVVCYGTLAQRTPLSSHSLDRLMEQLPASCVRLCDLNVRQPFATRAVVDWALSRATAVKLNEIEARVLREMFDLDDVLAWLLEDRHVDLVALTRGPRGCVLVTGSERIERPGSPAPVGGDTVGAGDAFTAVLAHHLARSSDPATMAHAADAYAAFVASRPGAMPVPPKSVRALGLGVGSPP